jgi:type VI secretion system protein ImpA
VALVLPIEELLEKVSDTAPCGVLDAANEAQIIALDGALKRSPQNGLQVLRQAAEGLFRGGRISDLADFSGEAKVEVKAVKHLKAAMVLTLAGLESEGLPGFADGLTLIERLLATQWEAVYPLANADDPEEPYVGRVNVLSPLSIADPAKAAPQAGAVFSSDSWRMEERLLKAVLLQSDRHGALSVRDCLSPWAKKLKLTLPAGEDRTAEFIHEVRLAAADATLASQHTAFRAAMIALGSIDSIFKKAPGEIKPKLDYLTRLLKAASDVLEDRIDLVDPSPDKGPIGPKPANANGGPVSSREEAVRKLSEVAEYFRRQEPASPIPLLIDRVKRLAGMNFMALLEELHLGEEAAPEFRKLAGIREQPSTGGEGAASEAGPASNT